MGLWLEHRDENGLVERAPFLNGMVSMDELVEYIDDAPAGPAVFSLKEAIALAKPSAHLPREKREWALRIDFPEVP